MSIYDEKEGRRTALEAAVELTYGIKCIFLFPDCDGICVLMLCGLCLLYCRHNCGGLESHRCLSLSN